jgi:protein subunit release factor B
MSNFIAITGTLAIARDELDTSYIRSGGPGGS